MTQVAIERVHLSLAAIVPAAMPTMRDWLINSYYDRRGAPFNEHQVPWVTAPNGPCDAIDNPQFNEIWLQWASRMFKTTLAQSLMQRQARHDPTLMMFATRNENLCKQVMRRLYEILENNPLFRDQIPSEKARNATTVDFRKCRIVGTWAGSKSGLADESILVGHANEVDKWEHPSTSEEGDPLPRFLKRGGEFPDRKFIIESTPSQKGSSRIERGVESGTNCRYWVPCPHCNKFQPINFGNIEWEGRRDADMARETAQYVCDHCSKLIHDEYRYEMMNAGVWVNAGCHVNDDLALKARDLHRRDQFHYPWMLGDPLHNANIYSSQLSVFYALFHGWGDIAADFLRKKASIVDHRQWITEEKGETWIAGADMRELPWEDLVERIVRPDTKRGVVPEGFSLLTICFDRQSTEKHDKPIPYMVCAWDYQKRCHIVDYDYVASTDEILEVVRYKYQHADGGDPLRASRVLADSGFEPSQQRDICLAIRKLGIHAQLCKGSATDLNKLYNERRIERRGSNMKSESLVWVDTLRSQDWTIRVLHDLHWEMPEGLSVYDGTAEEHEDLARQLLNDEENDKGRWVRIHKHESNDYRDCLRYNKVCMERETRNRAPRRRILAAQQEAAKKQKQKQRPRGERRQSSSGVNFLERPGGWI